MRQTTVRGIDNELVLELGSDTSLIGEIIDIGRVRYELVYEKEMSGEELIDFLVRHSLFEKHGDKIKKENKYLITAYDW